MNIFVFERSDILEQDSKARLKVCITDKDSVDHVLKILKCKEGDDGSPPSSSLHGGPP